MYTCEKNHILYLISANLKIGLTKLHTGNIKTNLEFNIF